MLQISYREADRSAVIFWAEEDLNTPWIDPFCRILLDGCSETTRVGGFSLVLPWWAFLGFRSTMNDIFRGYGLSVGRDVLIQPEARVLLLQANQNADAYRRALASEGLAEETMFQTLQERGFKRQLTPQQTRNIRRIGALPAGATFSVPGAGKTTEALASFLLRSQPSDKLLVIAPKNAFSAWDEQAQICLGPDISFVRLRGGIDHIKQLLDENPQFSIMTYQQVPSAQDLLGRFLSSWRVHVYLDESHRIKNGKITARSLLELAHLPAGKLIMSGTPMPQAVEDLIPQFSFIYPEVRARTDTVQQLITPVFVRTTKGELGLPAVDRSVQSLTMGDGQHQLYQLLHSEAARLAERTLSQPSRDGFRRLGRCIIRLLQAASNPALLAETVGLVSPKILADALSEGAGIKINHVIGRTRNLVRQGHKVLIWTSFVRNVEYLALRLADLGAVYIHGGVDAGSDEDEDTREGKIRLFHDDPNVMVLIANPAAASEGISLHTVCHHAIYLDRTFNAAHYLQSEDRIHRLGLEPNQHTYIEIVEASGTVDEVVRGRLGQKVSIMAQALDDTSLNIDPLAQDVSEDVEVEDSGLGLDEEDIRALFGPRAIT